MYIYQKNYVLYYDKFYNKTSTKVTFELFKKEVHIKYIGYVLT